MEIEFAAKQSVEQWEEEFEKEKETIVNEKDIYIEKTKK